MNTKTCRHSGEILSRRLQRFFSRSHKPGASGLMTCPNAFVRQHCKTIGLVWNGWSFHLLSDVLISPRFQVEWICHGASPASAAEHALGRSYHGSFTWDGPTLPDRQSLIPSVLAGFSSSVKTDEWIWKVLLPLCSVLVKPSTWVVMYPECCVTSFVSIVVCWTRNGMWTETCQTRSGCLNQHTWVALVKVKCQSFTVLWPLYPH